VVVGYQRLRGPCCLHLHPEDDSPKRRYPTISLQDVMTGGHDFFITLEISKVGLF